MLWSVSLDAFDARLFKTKPRCILIEQKYWRFRHCVQRNQSRHMYSIEADCKKKRIKEKCKSSIEINKGRLQYKKEYGNPNKSRIKIEKYLEMRGFFLYRSPAEN